MSLDGFAVLDVPVTGRIRVRSWHHRSGRQAWPTGTHPDVEVAWVSAGALTYRIGSRELEVAAGQAVIVPPRVDHATRVEHGTRAGSVWLSPELVAEVAACVGRRLGTDPIVVANADRVAALGSLLVSEARLPGAGQLMAVEALAEALAITLVRADNLPRARRTARDPRIAIAVSLMEERYADDLSVDDIARAAGISRFHMSRMFREEIGESPYRFLQRTRIERAAELLGSGRHGVTEAALSVGFRDLGRFAKAFREQMGVSPSELVARTSRRASA